VKRHAPDWTSLIAGLTFCVVALAYLGSELMNRTLELRWVAPILLIGLGVAGLAGTVVRARRIPVVPAGAAAISNAPPDAAPPAAD
jgi:hypothetical protein